MTSNSPPTGQRRMTGRIAAWTAVATIGALAVAGVALATPRIGTVTKSAPSPAPSASGPTHSEDKSPARGGRPGRGKRHGLLPRLGEPVHGEAVVRGQDGKFATAYTQRGAVTAVSATSISLKSADDFASTYAVSAETKVIKHRGRVKIGDVKAGDLVSLVAVKSGDVKHAQGIRIGGDKGEHPNKD